MSNYKTRPIGEIFEHRGIKLQVIKSNYCFDCYFCGITNCYYYMDKIGYCGESLREDNKNVIFKRINE